MAAAVKLTEAEALALVAALEDMVGTPALTTALVNSIGVEKAFSMIEFRKPVKLTKAETVALVKAIVPLIPGATLKAKIAAVLKAARPCFATAERFKEVTAYVVARLKAYAANPSQTGGGSNSSLPAIVSKFLVFWIPANCWAQNGEKRLLEYVDACGAAGVNFGMEMAQVRAEEPAFTSEANLAESIRLWRVALDRCRKWNIWCLTSVLNNNSHIQKYDTVQTYTFTKVWDKALRLLAAVKDAGPANQIVQPCAETQTADGKKWEDECVKQLSGFEIAYNGSGGRPKTKPAKFTRIAYHPQKTSEKVPAGSLAVSDCGSIILQLHSGYAGAAKPDTLKAWVQHCRDCGAIAAGDYAFKYDGEPDVAAIKALAEAAAKINGDSVEAPSGDDVDLSKAVWHGPDGSGAVVCETVSNISTDGKQFRYEPSKGTDAWEPHTGAKNVNQYSCFFVMRNGVWTGGKFDYSTYSRKTRPLDNIRAGYTGGVIPNAGEEVRFCLMDLNGKKRTNAPGVIWK